MNEKINELIEWLDIKTMKDDETSEEYFVVGNKEDFLNWYSKTELRDKIKKILGIDKQCFQCLQYYFEHDLSIVEETGDLVCQDCAEGIISGNIKVKEK